MRPANHALPRIGRPHRRSPARLILDPRQGDLLADLAALPPVQPRRIGRPKAKRQSFDYQTWLVDMRARTDVLVRGRPNGVLPKRLGFMCGNVAKLRNYNGAAKSWIIDEGCEEGTLAIAMLQSAWADAAWVEKGRRCLGGELRHNSEAARKRAYRAEQRLSGIAFLLAPPVPSAWGWCPTVEG